MLLRKSSDVVDFKKIKIMFYLVLLLDLMLGDNSLSEWNSATLQYGSIQALLDMKCTKSTEIIFVLD